MPNLPEPTAWLCSFLREDETTDRQVVFEDPETTRWADVADGDGVSPYQTQPLYTAEQVRSLLERYSDDGLGNERKRFVRITYDGSHLVVTPKDVQEHVGDGNLPEGEYKLTDVYLSEQEFEKLPEFDGF